LGVPRNLARSIADKHLISGEKEHVSDPLDAAAHIRQIIAYYEDTYLDYRVWWTSAATLAMHYGFWDEQTTNHADAQLNMNRVLAAQAELKPNDHVLDAGCGVGGSAIWLAQEFGVQVVGISLLPSEVRRGRSFAQRRGVADRVTFERQDFTHTNFPDGSFDVIWAIESICHAPDKREFLAEARRLLKPGGRLVVADGFRARRPLYSDEERSLDRWLSGWAVPDLMTAEEFADAARQVGFAYMCLDDITTNIQPSARRMYHLARVLYPVGIIQRALRLVTSPQLANARSALEQYQCLRRGLWFYGIARAAR
jgi:cyclopropane fatty-acyl-phospholipid synthase-like methyltransferase